MARLFIEGFELNDLSFWSYSGTPTIKTASTYDMSGEYCIELSAASSSALVRQLDSSYSSAYFALKFRHGVTSPYTNIIKLYDGINLLAQVIFGGSAPNQYLALCDNTATPTGGILVSGIRTDIGINVTRLIEFFYEPHLTTGTFIAKIDGIIDINYTGKTSSSSSTFNKIGLIPGPYVGDGGQWDDIIIDDTNWIGDTKVISLMPDGDGYSSTWSSTPTGSHYSCVDDVPISTVDYIYSNNVGDIDFFTVEALPDDVHSISSVTVSSYSKEVGTATPQNIQVGIRTNDTNYFSSDLEVSLVNDTMLYNTWTVNPSTGSAFSLDDIENIQIGIKATA